MPPRHVIVDGSNLATEGRSLPSLAQLDQAVREFLAENPTDVVTVVVDASFGHRINPSELPMFEGAEVAGEVVSPPAGAIGRGDAFLLRIAEKTGATVLSNDSFQEFHGEHPWLFDDGRLIGGKPVPGVGWIFMPRTPVRGQRSREVVKEAKRKKRGDDAVDTAAAETGLDLATSRAKGRPKKVDRAIARATEEAVEPKAKSQRRRRSLSVPPADPVNEPLAFITFIAAHPLGSEVVGNVVEFSSHGAFVQADGARCYIPLSAMGDPPPRRAREVVAKGADRVFVVQALDPLRRGVELALPGYARVAGGPTAETVEAEIHPRAEAAPKQRRRDNSEVRAGDGSAEHQAIEPSPLLVGGSPANGAGAPEGDGAAGEPAIPAFPARPDAEAAGKAPAGKKATPAKKAAGTAQPPPVEKSGRVRKAAGAGAAAVSDAAAEKSAAAEPARRPSVKKAAGIKSAARPTAKKVAAAQPPSSPPAAKRATVEPASGRPARKSAGAKKAAPAATKKATPTRKTALSPTGARGEPEASTEAAQATTTRAAKAGASPGLATGRPARAATATKAAKAAKATAGPAAAERTASAGTETPVKKAARTRKVSSRADPVPSGGPGASGPLNPASEPDP
jgi:hypothetical protein